MAKSIGGFIRDISKEVQDTRMVQARSVDGDEFDSGSTLSYVTHHRRLLQSLCVMMEEDFRSGALREKMKKASAICQRIMLLIDNEERDNHRHLHQDDDGCQGKDLCDSCCQQDGCTIPAGRTASCARFQPIGGE